LTVLKVKRVSLGEEGMASKVKKVTPEGMGPLVCQESPEEMDHQA
jgi:hypothetical protein